MAANVATLSGDVTRARPSGVFVGIQSFILTGTFASASDTSALGFSSGPPACTPLVFQSPITEGEIIVHDSL